MTLIFEVEDTKNHHSVYISDCLVSLLNQKTMVPNLFPLHFESGWSIDTSGVALASKISLRKDRVLLSAGQVDRIASVSSEFPHIESLRDFQNFLDVFYENKGSLDSFIYGITTNGRIGKSCTNAQSFSSRHLNFYAAGSGAEYLRSLVQKQVPNEEFPGALLAIQLLGQIVRLEYVDYEFSSHSFGSAYEVCFRREDGFERVPYTIIDSIGETEILEGNNYELKTRTFNRVILCCPFREGSLFVAISFTEDPFKVMPYYASEIGKEPPSISEEEIISAIEGHQPEFTISLLRHHNVDVAVIAENLVSLGISNARMKIAINDVLLEEKERAYFGAPQAC